MADQLYHELVSQFAEMRNSKETNVPGVIWAIQARTELSKAEEKCGISDRSALKCAMLGKEIGEAIKLEKKILELMTAIIEERNILGDDVLFAKNKDRFFRSELYQYLRELYVLRYGTGEAKNLDKVFTGTDKWKEDSSGLMVEYRRHKDFQNADMSPSNFYIRRLYIQELSHMKP